MAKSHPTYDQWGKKAGTFNERMKKTKPLYAYTEERAAFEMSKNASFLPLCVSLFIKAYGSPCSNKVLLPEALSEGNCFL